MKFLTDEESYIWRRRHWPVTPDESSRLPLFPGQGPVLTLEMPKTVKQLELLSRWICDWFADSDDVLCWITDWPLFKEEQMSFFTRWRKGFGETRELIDAPGQLFGHGELSEVSVFVFLVMIFEWDCFFIPSHGKAMFFVSHDGYMSIYHEDRNKMQEMKEQLTGFEFVIITE